MKMYYIMVHFGGPYVDGFIARGDSPWEAVSKLKKELGKSLIAARCKKNDYPGSNDHPSRIRQILQALKHPWRMHGGNRMHEEKKMVPYWPEGKECQVVNIIDITDRPLRAGFWLEGPGDDEHICNTPSARVGTKAERAR